MEVKGQGTRIREETESSQEEMEQLNIFIPRKRFGKQDWFHCHREAFEYELEDFRTD